MGGCAHTHLSGLWEQGSEATTTGSTGKTDTCSLSTLEILPGIKEMDKSCKKTRRGRVKIIPTCQVCGTRGC